MLEELKKEVCQANKDIVSNSLVLLTWGNVSAIDREKNIVAIKPSGVDYDKLTPADIVLVDLDGKVVEGEKRPSSDTPTHLELYKEFADAKAIVHTHSEHATVFAQAKTPVECMGTTHADHFYGAVPVTRDLKEEEIKQDYEKNTGKVILELFKKEGITPSEMSACLVSQHGPFCWGKTVKAAVQNAIVLEQVAKMKLDTLRLNKDAQPIDQFLLDKHFLRKHGKDAYYGQK